LGKIKTMKIYSAGDYAGLESKHLNCYFGYEEMGEKDEWLFIAKFSDTTIKIPQSKLEPSPGKTPLEYLLSGIGKLFDKHRLI